MIALISLFAMVLTCIMIVIVGIGANKSDIAEQEYGYDNYIYLDDDYNNNHNDNYEKELDNLDIYQKFQYILNPMKDNNQKNNQVNCQHLDNNNKCLSKPIPIPKQNYK